MEKRLIKRTLRYHKISHNKHLEALICLYKDYLYIKVDVVYEDIKARDTYYEVYISHYEQVLQLEEKMSFGNISEKMIYKVYKVLIQWEENKLFKFSNDGKIKIEGGKNDGK